MSGRPTSNAESGGGFLALREGDRLADRYTVKSKVGVGRYATVWLVQDDAHPDDAFVVKVLSAHATEAHDEGISLELQALKTISDRPYFFDRHVIFLRHSFEHDSGDARHLCLVLDACAQSLASYVSQASDGKLHPRIVKRIAAQLLEGLSELHGRDIIHTDLKPSNIFFTAHLDVRQAALARPMLYYSDNGREKTKVLPKSEAIEMPWQPTDDLDTSELYGIVIGDLGQAQIVGSPPTVDIIQPLALRAPEVIIGAPFGPAADVWNFGCLVFELLTGVWLFDPEAEVAAKSQTVYSDIEAVHLRLMMDVTQQRFPEGFLDQGTRSSLFFDEVGTLRRYPPDSPDRSLDLRSALATYIDLSPSQLAKCTSFLFMRLHLDPRDGPSAAELREHPYLREALCSCDDDDCHCYDDAGIGASIATLEAPGSGL